MSNTYTPDEEQVREQYTREQPPQIGTVAEKHAEFDRFIAKVKADALREARDAMMPPYNCELNPDGTEDPEGARHVAVMVEVHDRLSIRADQIERGER